MTASVHDMRAEAASIAARRGDVIRPDAVLSLADSRAMHPVTRSKCAPFSALIHRVAALMTTEELPDAKVTVTPAAEVTVDLTGFELVQNGVRRWSAALGLDPVTEAASEVNGWAATTWSTSGFADGAHFTITGYVLLPTPVVDRFGCGIGPAT